LLIKAAIPWREFVPEEGDRGFVYKHKEEHVEK
jgi:hypothetical protein